MPQGYFCFFDSYIERTQVLTDAELGTLVRALSRYRVTGERPAFSDRLLSFAFDCLAADVDAGREKAEKISEVRKQASAAGHAARYKAAEPTPIMPNGTADTEQMPNGTFAAEQTAKMPNGTFGTYTKTKAYTKTNTNTYQKKPNRALQYEQHPIGDISHMVVDFSKEPLGDSG